MKISHIFILTVDPIGLECYACPLFENIEALCISLAGFIKVFSFSKLSLSWGLFTKDSLLEKSEILRKRY